MENAQGGIVPEAGAFALYALIKIKKDTLKVIDRCCDLASLAADIAHSQPGSQLKAAVSFSPAVCQSLSLSVPDDFSAFTSLGKKDAVAPATDCDVLVHIHSERHDLNFHALRALLAPIADEVTVIDETYGYRYLDSRDMTGFIDGTENPKKYDARADVAIIKEGECTGGSVVLHQRYVHKLSAWEQLEVDKQEKIIGRTKADSIELSEMPVDSHVGRVDIKEKGKGLKIVRHSLPYGTVSGEHGLLFLAYCNNQHNLDVMVKSMFGESDGNTDAMLRYSSAVTGAYMYAPSTSQLATLSKR
ncbi:Dyp-type peroxidase [Veronia pacifica]|uniref:Deferrochelatase n=1 Tax=Veronia pacifica TaxID=1080227 RepID=A0A1C3EEL5_9GAMM|nr:Dyp-type peroxidase [Veronia pacifica]ODA31692.1 deferrochelatase [Veronia pacifica]